MTEYAIDVQNLSKSFKNKIAVRDVSLKVRTGEIFGFLGPNGSGKTTTIRMLCGLLTPDSGRGTCLGYDIITQAGLIKNSIGYMTQAFSYYKDLTVEENLNFVAGVYEIPDIKAAVDEVVYKFELDPYRYQLAGKLSGGWQQRMALAAALLHQPKLLLLDEPTAGVDPKARRDFWDILHQLSSEGITTLVSTHYMDEAERCHRLAFISQGSLLIHGTTAEILQKVGLHTWIVTGKNLNDVNRRLKNKPGVDQIITFGAELHVSGTDKALLEKTIKQFQDAEHTWTPVTSNVEDVFIHLMVKE